MSKRRSAGRNPHPISESTADDIDIVSRVNGPIADRTRLQRSLLLTEISMLSYLTDSEAQPVLHELGCADIRYIERDGAQAFELMNEIDVVIACGGTEPNEWNDIKADANAMTDLAETIGRVHRGFKREVDDIGPELEETLRDETRNVWFTGHSLGGAMPTILAGRCKLSDIAAVPVEVVAFGSPRVGTRGYAQNAGITHVRSVNNNDIVARVPPTWLRYRHTGTRMYLNRNGNVRRITRQQRTKGRWAGFKDGLEHRRFDHFSDHAMADDVSHLVRANEPEQG